MKKYLLVFGIIFYSLQLLAEKIDGPANVRTGPKGFTVISLFDKVEVDCTEPIGDWFQIGVYVKITENQYKSKIPIQKGDTLINWKNEKVGIALANIPDSIFSTWYSGGAPGNPRRYGMEIYCFTYKSNIRPESIVENELEKLLNENLTDLSLKRFEKHMKEFNYREGILIPDYEQLSSFMVHENAIEDPSPLDRVRLIFEEDILIAIVHSRNMKINGIQTFPIERGRNLSILKKFDSIEQEKFIEKNKIAYYGID